MTPWGIYMKANRTGAFNEDAGEAKESMKGRARERPAPFSQARRSRRKQLLTGLMVCLGYALFVKRSYPLILRKVNR